MEGQRTGHAPTALWYEQPNTVAHWFYGVFEGGGAKGIAYSGALRAMQERACWFRAVAGASAGAITAALVAAGLTPEEMAGETQAALNTVQTRFWDGLLGLRGATGYFPSDPLRDWLDGILRRQLEAITGEVTNSAVTFADLFEATHVELNIVAANLSQQCQIVFSHLDTPKCAVADAVVASSAIPFAFPSKLLRVPTRGGGRPYSHHTIVDGGVWSNFPLYIFDDEGFRRRYRREPERLDRSEVLGFLLQEAEPEDTVRGAEIEFESGPGVRVNAPEWLAEQDVPKDGGSRGWLGVLCWLLVPFGMLGRLVSWNGLAERGRWPRPRSRSMRSLVDSIDGMLGGVYPLLMALFAFAVVFIGSLTVVRYFASDQWRAVRVTEWTDPGEVAGRLFVVALAVVLTAIAILTAFVTALGLLTNVILLRAVRRLLYGLVRTYVAGPGAPGWITERANIIALPIPATVTTLSFRLPPEERHRVEACAYEMTRLKLDALLAAPVPRLAR